MRNAVRQEEEPTPANQKANALCDDHHTHKTFSFPTNLTRSHICISLAPLVDVRRICVKGKGHNAAGLETERVTKDSYERQIIVFSHTMPSLQSNGPHWMNSITHTVISYCHCRVSHMRLRLYHGAPSKSGHDSESGEEKFSPQESVKDILSTGCYCRATAGPTTRSESQKPLRQLSPALKQCGLYLARASCTKECDFLDLTESVLRVFSLSSKELVQQNPPHLENQKLKTAPVFRLLLRHILRLCFNKKKFFHQ